MAFVDKAGALDFKTEPLVEIGSLDPSIRVELKYATADNFMKEPLYRNGAKAFLRRSVAERLLKAQALLKDRGLSIKVFDAYRPLSVQKRMFERFPYPGFVADPAKGSNHNRGAAVDVTLTDAQGREWGMPSAYDEFSPRSHIRYLSSDAQAMAHREILQQTLIEAGFEPLETEWWHFNDPNAEAYDVLDIPL